MASTPTAAGASKRLTKIRRSKDEDMSSNNNSGRGTIVDVDDVYARPAKDSDDIDFELSKDEAIKQHDESSFSSSTIRGGVGGTKASSYNLVGSTRQSHLNTEDDEPETYDDSMFSSPTSEAEEKEEDYSQMSSRSSPRNAHSNASLKNEVFEEARIRELLQAYFRVHAPKAIEDGRLEALVKWTRSRGVAKLRAALKEQFGADLYSPSKSLEKINETGPKKKNIMQRSFHNIVAKLGR